MAINPDILPYRLCAGIMMLNEQGHVFVGQRIDKTSEAWQMPQGGIDEGEKPKDAAIRELEEETGTDNIEFLMESERWHYYDLPPYLMGRLWNGKYRGQKQKWFAVRFLGDDQEINLQTAHPEFAEWKWVHPRDLPQIIVPFKRELYMKLIEEFKDLWS